MGRAGNVTVRFAEQIRALTHYLDKINARIAEGQRRSLCGR